MKDRMKKLPIWLLLVWPYVFFLGILMQNSLFFTLYCILTVGLCMTNLLNAYSYKTEDTAKELAKWCMVLKMVHTPFYLAVMVFSMIIIVSVISNSSILNIPIAVLLLIIFAFFFMITTSAYCAKCVSVAIDQGYIKKETGMILGVCSFIFVGDVICAVLLYTKIKSKSLKNKPF